MPDKRDELLRFLLAERIRAWAASDGDWLTLPGNYAVFRTVTSRSSFKLSVPGGDDAIDCAGLDDAVEIYWSYYALGVSPRLREGARLSFSDFVRADWLRGQVYGSFHDKHDVKKFSYVETTDSVELMDLYSTGSATLDASIRATQIDGITVIYTVRVEVPLATLSFRDESADEESST